MNNNKLIISIILATAILLFGGIWIVQKTTTPSEEFIANQDAQAMIEENSYDWGTIKLKGGIVNKTFTIKNTGTQALQIRNIKTSCMCTNATLTIDGQTSPRFGMHQKSNWVGKIPAGDNAKLEVTFDPAYHGPSGVGDITRQVAMDTNDINNPKLLFNLTAQVVN